MSPALPARSATAIVQKTARAASARAASARASYGSGWKGATCSTSAGSGFSLSGLLRPSQTFVHLEGHCVNRHRLRHSFQCKPTPGFQTSRTIREEAARGVCQKDDVARLPGEMLDARRDVHRITDHREFEPAAAPHRAHDDGP